MLSEQAIAGALLQASHFPSPGTQEQGSSLTAQSWSGNSIQNAKSAKELVVAEVHSG